MKKRGRETYKTLGVRIRNMNFKAVPVGKVSVGDEIRQKSDEELATFIEIVSRCGRCQWCIHKRDCYRSDDKKCAQGVKAFLGKTVMYEE